MFLSIIIPTFNEAERIGKTIRHIQNAMPNSDFEILVSDGESSDDTIQIAKNLGAITLNSPIKGRSGQMNYAVSNAKGDVYYFVHADSLPTSSFYLDINDALQNNFNCGTFLTRFDSHKKILRINEFFTRFNYLFFRGGDQSIFLTEDLWNEIGPYKEEMLIMEDYDLLQRMYAKGAFKLIKKPTLISARKYDDNSWLRVQLANFKVVKMYKNGASQKSMLLAYKETLNYRKNAF